MEQKEHDTGFWMPDIEDEENLRLLRDWSGEWTSLSTLKYIRLSRSGLKHESSFPPKGES